MKPTKLQNYRGLRDALLLSILEGNGTTENPYQTVEYVVGQDISGDMFVTLGKLVPLTEEERSWFAN